MDALGRFLKDYVFPIGYVAGIIIAGLVFVLNTNHTATQASLDLQAVHAELSEINKKLDILPTLNEREAALSRAMDTQTALNITTASRLSVIESSEAQNKADIDNLMRTKGR